MKQVLFMAMILTSFAFGQATTGESAPDFKLKSASGKEVRLSDYKGKLVVLEWLNHGCPFVKNHYQTKNMQNLQKDYTEHGVVWLSIISSAEGEQGYSTPDKALQDKQTKGSKANFILLDVTGKVGKMFGAKVTPHMYIIDKKGNLAYQGAIDSIPSTKPEDIKKAKPYVRNALDSLLEGEEVKVKESKPYGCGVKYKD